MKKETIITAIVFLGVGFLAGYIYRAQGKADQQQVVVSANAPQPQAENSAAGAMGGGANSAAMSANLPPGHPPIDTDPIVRGLEQEAAQNPTDPTVRVKIANYLYDHRQYANAIPWYQEALKLDPKNVDVRTDLGTCYYYVGRPQDALREYRRSLKADPKHEPTLYNLALVSLEATHDLRTAREAVEKLQKLNPNYPQLDLLKQKLEAAGSSSGNRSSNR